MTKCVQNKNRIIHILSFQILDRKSHFLAITFYLARKLNPFSKFATSLLFFNIKLFNLIFPEADFYEKVYDGLKNIFLSIAFSMINLNHKINLNSSEGDPDSKIYCHHDDVHDDDDDDDGSCEVWSFEF